METKNHHRKEKVGVTKIEPHLSLFGFMVFMDVVQKHGSEQYDTDSLKTFIHTELGGTEDYDKVRKMFDNHVETCKLLIDKGEAKSQARASYTLEQFYALPQDCFVQKH